MIFTLRFALDGAIYEQTVVALRSNFSESPCFRFGVHNILNMFRIFVLYFAIPLAFLVWRWRFAQFCLEIRLFVVLGLLVVFFSVTTYFFIPPRTAYSYAVPCVPLMAMVLALVLASNIPYSKPLPVARYNIAWHSLLLSIAFCILVLHTMVASRKFTWFIPETHAVALSGGIYQFKHFRSVAEYLRKEREPLGLTQGKEYMALRWPQPVLIAGLDLSVWCVSGDNFLDNNLPAEFANRNRILCPSSLTNVLVKQHKTIWVLDESEFTHLSKLLKEKFPAWHLKLLYSTGWLTVCRIEKTNNILSPLEYLKPKI